VIYVRNAWYVASWTQDLDSTKPMAVTVLDQPLVLWRAGGRVIAMEDRCVHRLAPLSRGRCEGEKLRCMYHGLLFDTGGKVVEIPGQELIPADAKVRTFPVVEKHSWIWVWMGDAAQADETLIPAAVGLDDPQWILGFGSLDYDAEARLINDNLLDFSHFSYVHEKTLGAGANFAKQLPKVTALQRGVRSERWDVNASRPERDADTAREGWIVYEYLIPGILLNWSGSFPAGTAESCKYERPDAARAKNVSFSSQAVTPTGAKTARYFFSFATHRDQGDKDSHEIMMTVIRQAFAEDKAMIEAQQRIIDATPEIKIMPTLNDRGVTIFNQLVRKFVRIEDNQGRAPNAQVT